MSHPPLAIQETIQRVKDKFRDELNKLEEKYKSEMSALRKEKDFWKSETEKMERSWKEAEQRYSTLMAIHKAHMESDDETVDTKAELKRSHSSKGRTTSKSRRNSVTDSVIRKRISTPTSAKKRQSAPSAEDVLSLGTSTKTSRLRKLTAELRRELYEGTESPKEIRKNLSSLQKKSSHASHPTVPRSQTPKSRLQNISQVSPSKKRTSSPHTPKKKSLSVPLQKSTKALPFGTIWDEFLSKNDNAPLSSPSMEDAMNYSPNRNSLNASFESNNSCGLNQSQSPSLNSSIKGNSRFNSPKNSSQFLLQGTMGSKQSFSPLSSAVTKSPSNKYVAETNSQRYSSPLANINFALSPSNHFNRSTTSLHSLDENSNQSMSSSMGNVIVDIPHDGSQISVSTDTAEMLQHIRSLRDMLGN